MFKLDERYLKNLEEFLDKKIQLRERENKIEIYADAEIQFILRKKSENSYVFQTIERGQILIEYEYNNLSEENMKRILAINLKGLFGESVDYSKAVNFKNISLKDLEKSMNDLVGREYYSINHAEVLRINLEQLENGGFDIYLLLSDGERINLAENIHSFSRFYNEAVTLKEDLNRVTIYQEIFNDKLVNSEIEEILFKGIN